jgi:eukaryotic-like serine/threonine-protein kinase
MIAELEPGDPRKVGPYWLLGRLGSGGMGRVFLGRSPGGRHVAVKVVRAELAGQADFRARFAREVASARTVSGLFTAPVVDADVDAPLPWLATAYVTGPSLGDAVAGHGPLPVPSVIALAAGLAEGLGAIHAAGIVHRDLKPSNVLLADDGPRVIDFGISRAAEESPLTGTGLIVGSPGFMSPEQARGHAVGPPTDVFSLGAVLTFAATGQGPFGTGSSATLLYRVVSTAPAIGNVPRRLRPLIERCLAKDPQQRPSPAQLLSELNAHPLPGWLPAPITRAIPSHAPPNSVPAEGLTDHGDDLPGRPAAGPGPPLPAGGPSTITAASAQIPDAPAPARQPGNGTRSPGRRRQPAIWALAATALLLAAAAIALAAVTIVGSHRHQATAEGTPTASPALSKQATTAASTSLSAQASSPSSIQPTVPVGVFWTAAVLSARYVQNAQQMVQRLQQDGFDGEYWRSTATNSTLPGYWVVTSGHFPDRAAATVRAQQLQAAGFTGAYARCVGPPQACASQG